MSEDIMSQVTQWLANIQVLHAVPRQRRTDIMDTMLVRVKETEGQGRHDA